jgi:hypothetical protein
MRRYLLLAVLIIFLSPGIYSQALINEFSSANLMTIADEDGAYDDWIELFNNSASDLNLSGYHLSDNKVYKGKWTFPSITIRPHSHLLVFASGKNRTALPLSYKTIIDRGADWQYLVPQAEQGDAWKSTGFDASSWLTGKSGFGYGDNDDETLLENIVSVFIRKEFTISDLSEISQLVLSIDYDDGFVAYINGHEIARSNLGSLSPVPFNQLTGAVIREATMYQGGSPENYTITDPRSVLVEGVNVIAIQGHNSDAASSDFSLIPMLTIGRINSDSGDSIPSYIQLKGTRLHTNFALKDEGENIILSRPDTTIADSTSPIRLLADVSYGRKPDGATDWVYFAVPTPGGPNSTKGFTELSADTVLFSVKGGYYPGGVTLGLSSVHNSDSIYYSLDGSEPTSVSIHYTAPFAISGNAIVRARSLKTDILPGPVATNTYITKKHVLPVVCVSTDPANLWDYNTGIYVMGPNAQTDPPYFGANFWQDWERKAHMEYYDNAGVKQIDQDMGIKIFGSWSRAFPEKSMALFARKIYGKGAFDYKFFKDKPIEKFESLVLRNAGNDWDQAFVRDDLTSMLVRDMDIDRQASQPCVIYINGEYWGILNMREKVNPNFLAENNFVNPDNVNLLQYWGDPLDGNNTSYSQLIDFLNNNSLETETQYNNVARKIDIDNYTQYQLTEIYINNKDWPSNNIKFWNTNDPASLWRWIIYDTDFGFSIWEEAAYTFNTLDYSLETNGPDWPNPPWSTLFFRRMVTNTGFRNQFANQFADRLNRNFSPERVRSVVDSVQNIFQPEIADHLTRWELPYDTWQYNYNLIRNFGQYRPDYMRSYIRSRFQLGDPLPIKVEIDDPGSGVVRINTIIPYKFPFNGIYFRNLPIKLTAIPAPGYKFVRWEMGTVESLAPTITYEMAEAGNFRAVFEAARNTDVKVVINEINYVSPDTHDTKDWVELYNAGASSVNLKGWTISDGSKETGFVIPSDYYFSPGEYYVGCRNLADFRKFWPAISASTGDFQFGLSGAGDNVNLYDPDGNLVDYVNYQITPPWPTDAVAKGSSIELINPFADNNDGKNWKTSNTGGTPGKINAAFNPADTTDTGGKQSKVSCFPNPFSDYTTLQIDIKVSGRYRVEIFNIQGKLLNTVTDQNLEPGDYYLDWSGRSAGGSSLPGGVYIIRLTGENQRYSTRVIKIN